MLATITLSGWIVAAYYGMRAGGPAAILRALRSPDVPRRYKVALAFCALPIPGPADELIAAALLARLARATTTREDR
jgi:hypothetical protein